MYILEKWAVKKVQEEIVEGNLQQLLQGAGR